MVQEIRRIFLIGFSGAGKSTVAHLLADRLGWNVIDTDADIERQLGKSVPEVFSQHGEAFFRSFERNQILAAIHASDAVIATGGGAVTDSFLWDERHLRRPGSLIVTLDADPQTILGRLRAQQEREGNAVTRPMIAGDDPLGRIVALKERRQDVYDRADVTLVVDGITPEAVADEVITLLHEQGRREPAVRLDATSGSSDIYISPGAKNWVGELVAARWPKARRAWVISDESVAALHADTVLANISSAGLVGSLVTVPSGESSKSWQVAGRVLDRLLDGGIERSDVVVALGGGVIGDLAGFVAAIALRGVPLVQVPTSLLAMVDSSVGGKTGINHQTGKNLIGAFYQPPIVVIDPSFLSTLPPRELTAGWAEVVKHAIIQPSTPCGERADLLRFLTRNAGNLRALREPALTYAIRRNVALKAAVVQADERESGIRAYLNFGHTMGHGIEAAGYRLLHGEAVAVGIRGVCRLARHLNELDEEDVRRIDALLDRFNLPATAAADESTVLVKMSSDKKRAAGALCWVMPVREGGVTIRAGIDDEAVRRALRQVIQSI